MSRPTSKGPGLTPAELRALPASVPAWPVAGQAFGISRSKTYALIAADEFPVRVMRLGRSYRCATADILAALGLSETPADTPIRTAS